MFSISLPGVIAIRATPSVGNVIVEQLTTTISCGKAKAKGITRYLEGVFQKKADSGLSHYR